MYSVISEITRGYRLVSRKGKSAGTRKYTPYAARAAALILRCRYTIAGTSRIALSTKSVGNFNASCMRASLTKLKAEDSLKGRSA